MSVRVEPQGTVSTVVIDRPGRKNAVDGFCAGADLKALGSEGSRVKPTGDGPMGKTTIDSGKSLEGAARFAGGAGRHGAPAA